MAVDYTGTAVGWVPYPEDQSSVDVVDQALDGLTTDYARYRIAYGRSSPISLITRVAVDSDGSEIMPSGNEPTNLNIKNLSDNEYRITWTYDEEDQPAEPTGFYLYDDVTGLDGTAISTILFRRANRFYVDTDSSDYSDLDQPVFKVRTYKTIDAVIHQSTGISDIAPVADGTGPTAIVDNLSIV